jgi:UDP-N-acetylglucosamine--N-acetylmuramyl-(pentapeptide) pyrophosphoryl-undecaprenol N-acetylglucosamine transferase
VVRIVFTGGGSGGHIFPIIAVIRELKHHFSIHTIEYEFLFMGPKDNFAPVLFFNEQVPMQFIHSGKLRRYFALQNFADIFKIPLGVIEALWRLWIYMPDVVFSKGGYGSFPVVFAAWLYRIPIMLHESDAIPGLANRILSHLVKKIAISFTQTLAFPLKKTIITGNPVRGELFDINALLVQKPSFSIDPARKVVLIIGGSQGAQRINDFILSVLPVLLLQYQVIHQCGEQNFESMRKEADGILKNDMKQFYTLVPFMQEAELRFSYAYSHCIVARAGSGSIFEIAKAQKPSILIPLSNSAQNHQSINASAYAATGAAIVLEENNLTPNLFMEKVRNILDHEKTYTAMSEAARSFAKPHAAYDIAKEIVYLM